MDTMDTVYTNDMYTPPLHVNTPKRRPKIRRSNFVTRRCRPDGLANRMVVKADNNATEQHWIVDTYAVYHGSHGSISSRRSNSQCLKYTGKNDQSRNLPVDKDRFQMCRKHYRPLRPEHPPQFVHIPEIHPNLYISDRASVDDWVRTVSRPKNFVGRPLVIVLFAGKIANTNTDTVSILTQDARNMSFHDFHVPYQHVKTALDDHVNSRPVLLACQSGVNRSCLMAVAYGIQNTEMTADQLMEYIMREKSKTTPDWDTLTNTRMRIILRQLQSQRPKRRER